MSRKQRRRQPGGIDKKATGTTPAPRYRPQLHRSPAKADFTDESQYVHVRGDLLRIAVLAFCLFGTLVLLRILLVALGLFA